jgi:hypothetical protein
MNVVILNEERQAKQRRLEQVIDKSLKIRCFYDLYKCFEKIYNIAEHIRLYFASITLRKKK